MSVIALIKSAANRRRRRPWEAYPVPAQAKDKAGHTKLSPKSVVNSLVRCVKQPQEGSPEYDELTGFEKNSGKSALA